MFIFHCNFISLSLHLPLPSYEEVEVKNFTTSWKDGMAFCAIIDRHRPDLLNYDDCDPDTPLSNLELAMNVAEKELGIVRIIDPEGIIKDYGGS